MSLSKEYSVYCLSESRGWINTKNKYDFKGLETDHETPEDTLMEIKFVTEIPYGSKVYKDEYILSQTKDSDRLAAALERHGERPEHPFP